MIKMLLPLFGLMISISAFALDPAKCLYAMKSPNGISPGLISQSYLVRIHKTLSGELDPYVLGDGGIVASYFVADGGATPAMMLVFFENNDHHPFTSHIERAVRSGWPYIAVKKECAFEVANKKQISALHSLVTEHMYVPRNLPIKFLMFR